MTTSVFVEQLYSKFLGRSADAAGKAYWVQQIDNGVLGAAKVTQAFMDSTEFSGVVSPVALLYYTALGRIPDAEGLQFWVQKAQSGAGLKEIAAGFASSAEFKAAYDSLSDEHFLDQLYLNVFSRAADSNGKAYWLAKISSGALGRADVVVGFAASQEQAVTKGEQIKVIVQYHGILNTTPNQVQIDAALAQKDAVAVINSLYANAAYKGVAVPGLATVKEVAGKVVDGYVKDALVFADANGDGVWNEGEAKATSDDKGNFVLLGAKGKIIASGGTDISTGKPFAGILTAPEGATVVNPLTTLQQAFIEKGLSAEQAQDKVAKALGFDASKIDLANFDPLGASLDTNAGADAKALGAQLHAEAAKVANLLVTSASTLIGAAGGESKLDLSTALNAVVQSVVGNIEKDTDGTISLADSGFLKTVLTEAVQHSADDNLKAVSNKVDSMAESFAKMAADVALKVDEIKASGGDVTKVIAQIAQVQTVAQGEMALSLKTAAVTGELAVLEKSFTGDALDKTVISAPIGDLDPNSTTDDKVADELVKEPPPPSGGGSSGGEAPPSPPSIKLIQGTNEADELLGTDASEVILGNGGDDQIEGGKGDDSLNGGTGNDQLFGGEGYDQLSGGEGDDQLSGGEGGDYANYFVDALRGQTLAKKFDAANNAYRIEDTDGNLLLTVSKNQDGGYTAEGHNAAAALGKDTIADDVEYLNFHNIHLQLKGWRFGSDFSDTLDMKVLFAGRGDSDYLQLSGEAGNDTLIGRDQLQGGDTFEGNAGDDSIDGGKGRDECFVWLGMSSKEVKLKSWAKESNTATIEVDGKEAFTLQKNADATFTLIGVNDFVAEGQDTLTNVERIRFQTGEQKSLELQLLEFAQTYPYNKTLMGGLFTGETIDATKANFLNPELYPHHYYSIDGDDAANHIIGSAYRDDIRPGMGNDTIDGGDGVDSLWLQSRVATQEKLQFKQQEGGAISVVAKVDNADLELYQLQQNSNGTVSIGGVLGNKTVSNVENIRLWNFGGVQSDELKLVPKLAGSNSQETGKQIYSGEAKIDVAADFNTLFSATLTATDYVTVTDDSRASEITGSVAREAFSWVGGSDSMDGGAGVDTVRLDSSIRVKSALSVESNEQGLILVKDGSSTVMTITPTLGANGATVGHSVSYRGDTLTLKNIEQFEFNSYPEQGGMGRLHTLNLGTSVVNDLQGYKELWVATGETNVNEIFQGLDSNVRVYLKDDFLNSSVIGSGAAEEYSWQGGQDRFEGGEGSDSAVLHLQTGTVSSFSVTDDGQGGLLFKQADAEASLSVADANGISTLSYKGGTLALKDVEKLTVYGSGQNEIYLKTSVSGSQIYAAGDINVTELLGDDQGSYSYSQIYDGIRSIKISGGGGSDHFEWNGGSDEFNAGTGYDGVRIVNGFSINAPLSIETEGQKISIKDAADTLVSIDKAAGTITTAQGGVKYSGLEALSFSSSEQGSGGKLSINYDLNLTDSSLQYNSARVEVTGDVNITSLLAGRSVSSVSISDAYQIETAGRKVVGSAVNDYFYWYGGNDSFDGGSGSDMVRASGFNGYYGQLTVDEAAVASGLLTFKNNGQEVGKLTKTDGQMVLEMANYGQLTLVGVEQLYLNETYVNIGTIFS